VLEGNLNVKMDRMSMLNGLAVRSPFLDHNVVDYVMQLPANYKIQAGKRKRILKDSFANLLPAEIYTRKKKGFDIPLQKWLSKELSGMIEELLNEKFLKEQNIFHAEEVSNIRKQLQSNNPGNSVARVWGLLVFQKYWINCIKK
jgi:asparagine synthase (glutamine-hydrolysing)